VGDGGNLFQALIEVAVAADTRYSMQVNGPLVDLKSQKDGKSKHKIADAIIEKDQKLDRKEIGRE